MDSKLSTPLSVLSLLAVGIVAAVTCASPVLRCEPVVPTQFVGQTVVGESEAVHYERAFRSLWRCCVQLRASDPEARCPFLCSGTPADAQGCADGATAAEAQIGALVERVGAKRAADQMRVAIQRTNAEPRMPSFTCSPEQRR